ncbi:hypothetical protein K435DRAFT_284708 [Dendrothele bispora CBS 962.96]|uniref:Uncharacterized protein n=1 Tax=Dendrothele bispora (strain CBS 962.96) TaxID=1314807 RepID=A0A4S8LKB2_DENBC|nr:hypothetical protein K435DRAFT_284708 [Dendrothele bispora CBS 962.96]
MLGAIGIGLGGSSEEDEGAADEGGAGEQISGGNREGLELLEVSVPAWNGERTDEVLYKIISMIIPRYRRLRTLLLKVAEEEREEEKDIEEGYEVGGAVTVTVDDADESTSMSRNQCADDTEGSTLTHSKSLDKLEQKNEILAPLTPTSTLTSSATVTPTSSTTPTPTAASYSYFPPSPRHQHQPHSSDTSSLSQTQTHLSPPTSPAYNQNRFSTSTTFSLTPSHTSSLSAAQSHEYDIVYGSSGDHSSMFSPPTPTMTASTVSLGLFPFPPASPLPTTDSGKTRENEDEDEDEGKRLSVDSGLGADGRLISMYLNNMHDGQYAEDAEVKVGENFLNERRKSSIQFSPSSSISSVSQLVDKKEEFQNGIVVDTVEVASGGTESVSPVNKEEEDGNDVEESIEEFGHDVEQDEDNPDSYSGSDSNFSPTSTATGYFSPVSTFGTVNSPRTGPLKPGYESDVPPVPSLPPLDSLPPVRPRMSVSSAQTVKPAKEGKSGKSLASRLSRLPSLKNLKKQSSKKSAVNDDASPNSASSPIPTSLTSLESTPTLLPPGADTASRLAPAMPKYVPNANESSPPPLPPKSPQSQQPHDLASNIVTKSTPNVDSHNQPSPSSKGKTSRFSTLSSLSTGSNLSGVSTLSSMSTMSVADAVIQRAGRSQLTPMTPTFRVTQVKPVVDGAENHVQRALSPRTVGVETSLSPSSQSLSSDFVLESPPNNKHNLRVRSAPELRAQTVDEDQGKEFTEIDEKEAIMVLAQEMDLREQRDREIRNTPLTQREKRHIRLWTRHCPTLEKVVFVSGKVWDVHGIVAEDKEEEVVEAEKKTVVVEKLDFGLELL